MGESIDDRCQMLVELARLEPHPESVPINALVRVAGTPLAALDPIDPVEFVRMIATAPDHDALLEGPPLRRSHRDEQRDAAPLHVRGRELDLLRRSPPTTQNPATDEDRDLLETAGVVPMQPAP